MPAAGPLRSLRLCAFLFSRAEIAKPAEMANGAFPCPERPGPPTPRRWCPKPNPDVMAGDGAAGLSGGIDVMRSHRASLSILKTEEMKFPPTQTTETKSQVRILLRS